MKTLIVEVRREDGTVIAVKSFPVGDGVTDDEWANMILEPTADYDYDFDPNPNS